MSGPLDGGMARSCPGPLLWPLALFNGPQLHAPTCSCRSTCIPAWPRAALYPCSRRPLLALHAVEANALLVRALRVTPPRCFQELRKGEHACSQQRGRLVCRAEASMPAACSGQLVCRAEASMPAACSGHGTLCVHRGSGLVALMLAARHQCRSWRATQVAMHLHLHPTASNMQKSQPAQQHAATSTQHAAPAAAPRPTRTRAWEVGAALRHVCLVAGGGQEPDDAVQVPAAWVAGPGAGGGGKSCLQHGSQDPGRAAVVVWRPCRGCRSRTVGQHERTPPGAPRCLPPPPSQTESPVCLPPRCGHLCLITHPSSPPQATQPTLPPTCSAARTARRAGSCA